MAIWNRIISAKQPNNRTQSYIQIDSVCRARGRLESLELLCQLLRGRVLVPTRSAQKSSVANPQDHCYEYSTCTYLYNARCCHSSFLNVKISKIEFNAFICQCCLTCISVGISLTSGHALERKKVKKIPHVHIKGAQLSQDALLDSNITFTVTL